MRVLVVDDEVRFAETLRRGLEREGFSVHVVHDGGDALWIATEQAFDLIVLDLMIPTLSGYRVIQGLRERNIWTPVIMLTAKDGEYDQVDALDLGADDYLTKPFSFVILVARLRALLRRGAPERPVVMSAGDLTLDPVSRSAARGGVQISLTPREYGLLEYLMRRKGEVVTKVDILDHVWDSGFEGPANIVEVYVGYLRRKLDVPFDRQSLQTLRGFGYRLSDEETPAPAS